jgi:hypothetical protein
MLHTRTSEVATYHYTDFFEMGPCCVAHTGLELHDPPASSAGITDCGTTPGLSHCLDSLQRDNEKVM